MGAYDYQPFTDRLVGAFEGGSAVKGEVVGDPATILGVGMAFHQATIDEAVHQGGDVSHLVMQGICHGR